MLQVLLMQNAHVRKYPRIFKAFALNFEAHPNNFYDHLNGKK